MPFFEAISLRYSSAMTPAAIGVGEDQVVELGQKARRSQGIRVGARRLGKVEQFLAALVAEGEQARPDTFDHLTEPGQTRPRLYVVDGGRAERPEVAQYRLLEGRSRV